MKKFYFEGLLPAMTVAGALALAGCTDSNYDLGKLDKTIAVGSEQGLVLPGNNSTKEIALADLFDLSETDVVTTDADGNYVFSQKADASSVEAAHPEVDEIELSKEEGDNNFLYDMTAMMNGARANAKQESIQEIYNFHFDSDVADDVLQLVTARLRSSVAIHLDFSEDLKMDVEHIEKLTLDLPEFLDINVSDVATNGASTQFSFDKSKNLLTFTNLKEEGVDLNVTLNALIFNVTDENGYYLNFDQEADSIHLYGGVKMDVDFNEAAAARARGNAAQQPNYFINCFSKIEDITLTGGQGYFSPSIDLTDGLGNFSIGELPDFLKDDEVKLVVSNPQIIMNISSNIDITGKISNARIVARDENGNVIHSVSINPFSFKPHKGEMDTSTTTTVVVSDKTDSQGGGSNTDNEAVQVSTSDEGETLSALISDVQHTDNISFECTASSDDTEMGDVSMGTAYTIQPEFEFNAPLAFDEGSIIVYRDTIDGWHSDLEDLSLTDGSYVEVTTDAINRLPLDLRVDVQPMELDANGNMKPLSSNVMRVDIDGEIKAGSVAAPKTSKITIRLTQASKDALSRIDGIFFRARAKSSSEKQYQGLTLNERTQKLKLDRIGITLHGKVIKDLDD